MSDSPVRLERRGAVGILTLDRADRRNALSRETLHALGRLGRELAADDTVRAIVITGAGDKAFCAGADLKERQGMSTDEVRAQVGLYRSELGVLDISPKPVIAAVNGVAFGGGLELARLRQEHAELEVRVGEAGAQRQRREDGAPRTRERGH